MSVIAYKFYRTDWTSFFNPAQPYEFGKQYSVENELRVRRNGFHAWSTIEHAIMSVPVTKNVRLARVELSHEVKSVSQKLLLARTITILNEINLDELFQPALTLTQTDDGTTTTIQLYRGYLHNETGPAYVQTSEICTREIYCRHGKFLGADAVSERILVAGVTRIEYHHDQDSPFMGTPPLSSNCLVFQEKIK